MVCKLFRSGVVVRTALLVAVSVCLAKGDTVTASLYSPGVSATGVPIVLKGFALGSSATLTGSGYSITFSSSFPTDQGIVRGAAGGLFAIPVAGVTSGNQPEYLTGDYGSALTPNSADAGKYLSTGLGTITIAFTTPQTSLALLWGSIDKENELTLNDGASFTGTEIQDAAKGFVSNGFQGPGGSAYVVIESDSSFTTATFSSGVVSFEFSGVEGSTTPFNFVPEPSSIVLIGIGIVIVALRRRQVAKAATLGRS